MRKTWEHRRPIIKFRISPYRKSVKPRPKPVKRSKYAESLFQEGAGWNE
ncbi:MAG TPA: hypothetical protein VK105_20340 [Virgibacillus sp.]|nr:hypothetical protein [Virgibacillus sp.]HLR69443.1 hypothetical protein [Virgibacillus sp.]